MQHFSGTQSMLGCKKCLIIEDSEFDQRMMSRVLDRTHSKMQIEVASTLGDGWHALQRGAFSLVLLDNNLPDGYGANFVLKMAADKKLSAIPIIMVSDWPSPFMWDKFAMANVCYVVNKSEFEGRYVTAALRGKRSAALGHKKTLH